MSKIKISPLDNVDVNVGGEYNGHKTANRDIKKGENIIKYGYPIGHATEDIAAGEHVHTHNIKTNLSGLLEYKYEPAVKGPQKADEKVYFKGYVRDDGSVGIRNEIWIVNTVGCINKTSEKLAKLANEKYAGKTDGIFNFVHPFGCSQLGDDQKTTQAILKGMVNHPNAAGVLVLGLGCENNNIPVFKEVLGEYNPDRVKFMSTQDYDDEIEEGLKLIGELVEYAQGFTRTKCDISKLVVGLKCGGSDGFSGLTANPLVGQFSDLLIAYGGSTILTEVPEMFGAETLLMNRCRDEETFHKTVDLINNFKEYFMRHNQVVYENPSPGNKKGGITTLEDKSLGCVQKSGTSDVVDVIQIGEHVKKQGLNLLTGPGNDIVAVTNLTASGCHLILFTTGRGTPVGAPVPTVKISSNSNLAERKPHWIDFNAGPIVDGEVLTQDLFDFVLDVANGRKTNNEKNGYREISIFKDGVVL
ncbi:MAG TPA: altronate dehydratase family protein [Candidatus Monoglobus merdigallinarum]|uniref:Altronate dehydratase family protein n=1 Tax=Candidatus Monoglobus merdigallinarum TaxID=2838698 RepID=A0A9D1PSW2_9FIRM|nr:altronate dehydratase family protein [Candidatus Monoglobus merdigallinarum]